MNYELAKKLKDAGYSQVRKLGGKVYFQNGKTSHIVCEGAGYECDCTTTTEDGYGMAGAEETVYAPTLSELIEACGRCLFHIKRIGVNGEDYWWAVSHCGHPEHEWSGNNLEEQGKTPEEAAANLWLELNKNKC